MMVSVMADFLKKPYILSILFISFSSRACVFVSRMCDWNWRAKRGRNVLGCCARKSCGRDAHVCVRAVLCTRQ